jgi:hypothetical protein
MKMGQSLFINKSKLKNQRSKPQIKVQKYEASNFFTTWRVRRNEHSHGDKKMLASIFQVLISLLKIL